MGGTVTTWYLEQTSADDLRPARPPAAPDEMRVVRAEVPSGEYSRFLYTAVGSDVSWVDRLTWPPERWAAYVARPAVETWVGYVRGTPAGYIELAGEDGDQVEIVYFGLLPAFRGRGLGGHLLTHGARRAWDLAGRWPGRGPTRRVWVHTCSLDGRYALGNYRRRGFRVFRTDVDVAEGVGTPERAPVAGGAARGGAAGAAPGTADDGGAPRG